MNQTPNPPHPAAYRADIDGLRAIAILLVLVFHFDLIAGARAGFLGVDVFFVISGFLITSIIRQGLEAGTFRLGAFYIGRVRRLAPALVATLVLTLAAGALLLFPHDFIDLAKQVLASQLYVANIYYWKSVNYFGLHANDVHLLHTWSLAVEEQFYLLFPVALLLVHRFARRHIWTFMAVVCALSFALNVALVSSKPGMTFYLLPTRAWELMVGGLIPAVASAVKRSRTADNVLGLAGLLAIALSVALYREDIPVPGWYALAPVLGSALLILAGTNAGSLTSRWLTWGPAVAVGKISYPLYLVHWPIHVFASHLMGEGYDVTHRAAMFLVSIVLATLIYLAVENPVRYRRVLSMNVGLLTGYGAAVCATVAAFAVILLTNGLPQRFPDEVSRLANYVDDRSPPLAECEFLSPRAVKISSFCKIGVATGQPRWIVYGDSHAWAAHDAFDKWLAAKGETGLFIYRQSCPPIMGTHLFGDQGQCFAFNESVAALLADRADIENVVLVSTWRQAVEGRLSTAQTLKLSNEESLKLFEGQLSATLTRLSSLGKRIYVWEPVPGATRSVPISMAMAALQRRPANIEVSREHYMAENQVFFSVLSAKHALVAASFSPSEALCGRETCRFAINGVPAYFDNAHITRSTADFWVQMMQKGEAVAGAH